VPFLEKEFINILFMKKLILFLTILFFNQLNAQTIEESFYEHYTGLISKELKLTADLIKSANSFSGFYYYEYEEDGFWISSNPIALDGRVNNDGSFVLNEFGGHSSYFQGNLENSQLIKGVWVNEMLKDDVDFTLKATYPEGSIHLNVVEQHQKTYFQQNQEMPSANYKLLLLFPNAQLDDVVYHQLLSRIYYNIGFRGEISEKSNIIAQLASKYNQQFQNALSNVQLDSFPNSFNWEKSIRMDVINNQSGLLCLQFDTYAKSGSREGTLVRKYLVFDINENKVLKIKDLFNETESTELSEKIQSKLRVLYKLDTEKPLTEFGFFNDTIPVGNNYYIHPGGIGFYYNVYEIAPFSNGPTDIFIPWSEFNSTSEKVEGLKNILKK